MGLGMKSLAFLLMGILLLISVGCGSSSLAPPPTNSTPTSTTHNQWTWVSGSNLANQAGTYGTQGTPAASNTPGGRYGSVSWTDASGNFWLFGGIAAPSATQDNIFNDLWKFSAGQWTWMGGSNAYN
jgi:hypothetical protein